ncbi:predicted protein [Micromonas commoda]|uniref:Thioredoxin domain-containing protein n=1 Tax=Micromonas commoda (strain RCC299 / NOUM17 / CCMP2709) TaxID=296587 RepID=C1FF85_MICCC|nr:predicted protein [Micromonas commoda]ACO68705.1 predicted protein [Micromonas commoda]|eukprot:XP_002507447.1 predicted protein [Micromonas commoda]
MKRLSFINRGADDDEPGRAWPMATRESRRSSWRALLLVPLLVAALVLGAPAAADDDDDAEEFTTAQFLAPTDGSLVTFDPSTLFGALVNHTVVVAFTVEWCALCTGYVPEFARVAAAFANANATDDGLTLPGDDDDDESGEAEETSRRRRRSRHPDPGSSSHKKLVFGTVDAETHKRLAATFGVTNAPYVALLRNDDWYDRDTGVPHAPAPRFGGYLAFAPTVEWLNAHLGTDVHAKPIVADLSTETIDAYVADPNADVLVQFYAPWCGHCKQFAKFYHEIGAHFSADPTVKIARLDVDAHRAAADAYGVTGLPSLQLFPRGYKRRGLHFRGSERTPARIISFVKSPQVYLVDATVTDMPEWDCVLWLESRGVLGRGEISGRFGLTPEHLRAFESVARDGTKGEGDTADGKNTTGDTSNTAGDTSDGGTTRRVSYDDIDSAADADDAARAMIAAAHSWAGRSRWLETMEILTCVSHTPALRRTGIGSSPAMWNFLDNAKLHVEDPSLAGDSADDSGLDGEDWDDGEDGGATGFAEAVAKAEAAAKRLEDGEDGKEDGKEDGVEDGSASFDWHAWEEFTARRVGDSAGEHRELATEEFDDPEDGVDEGPTETDETRDEL